MPAGRPAALVVVDHSGKLQQGAAIRQMPAVRLKVPDVAVFAGYKGMVCHMFRVCQAGGRGLMAVGPDGAAAAAATTTTTTPMPEARNGKNGKNGKSQKNMKCGGCGRLVRTLHLDDSNKHWRCCACILGMRGICRGGG